MNVNSHNRERTSLNVCYVPGSVLSALHALSHLNANKTHKVDVITTPILQIGKLKLRRQNLCTQGHRVYKC